VRFREDLDAGTLAMSTVTLLEQRASDQSPEDSRRFDRLVLSKLKLVPTDAVDVDRAREVQAQLLAKSQHRGPSIPDLLVAAVAERRGFTVLHLDRDFETIATVTRQPERRIADLPAPPPAPARPPRGTGIAQRRWESVDGHRYAPHVACAGCRRSISDITDATVHYHVSSEHGAEPLEGRLAFVHTGCSHSRPVVDYRGSSPMTEWLADLCRALRTPESAPGVFDVAASR
jgi:hypothetical protein